MSAPERRFGLRRERARQVQSFDELRVGLVIWIYPCPAPGCLDDAHRGILLNRQTRECLGLRTGSVFVIDGYELSPPVHGGGQTMVGEPEVRHGAAWAVIDEPRTSRATTQTTRGKVVAGT